MTGIQGGRPRWLHSGWAAMTCQTAPPCQSPLSRCACAESKEPVETDAPPAVGGPPGLAGRGGRAPKLQQLKQRIIIDPCFICSWFIGGAVFTTIFAAWATKPAACSSALGGRQYDRPLPRWRPIMQTKGPALCRLMRSDSATPRQPARLHGDRLKTRSKILSPSGSPFPSSRPGPKRRDGVVCVRMLSITGCQIRLLEIFLASRYGPCVPICE